MNLDNGAQSSIQEGCLCFALQRLVSGGTPLAALAHPGPCSPQLLPIRVSRQTENQDKKADAGRKGPPVNKRHQYGCESYRSDEVHRDQQSRPYALWHLHSVRSVVTPASVPKQMDAPRDGLIGWRRSTMSALPGQSQRRFLAHQSRPTGGRQSAHEQACRPTAGAGFRPRRLRGIQVFAADQATETADEKWAFSVQSSERK